MFQKAEGLVIRTTEYGESNRILTIYTREYGKIGVMARGARKPKSRFSAVSQLFSYGYFLFPPSRSLKQLQQAELISTFRHLRSDIIQTAYAAYIVELLDKLTDEQKPNPYLFELVYQTLTYIDEGLDPEILMHLFEMKMLIVAGIRPEVDACLICGHHEGEFHFSVREGGFICHRCFARDPYRIKVSQKTIRLLRLFYHFDLKRLGEISVSKETKNEIKTVMDAYYDAYAGIYLKSKKFLQQLEQIQ